MYIVTKIYKNGLLAIHQEMKYKNPEELKDFKRIIESFEPKVALLSLSSNN